jgi:glutamate formiminotransferase/formiminotetrahydrofolate cyclodeaminase
MVAGLTIGKKKYVDVQDEMQALSFRASALRRQLAALVQRDADAYERVRTAHAMAQDTDVAIAARDTAIRDALIFAADVPLETATAAVQVAEIAAAVAERGNSNAVTDAAVAALMAEVACKGAVLNVRINVSALGRTAPADARRLNSAARACLDQAASHARIAEAAAERAMVVE